MAKTDGNSLAAFVDETLLFLLPFISLSLSLTLRSSVCRDVVAAECDCLGC